MQTLPRSRSSKESLDAHLQHLSRARTLGKSRFAQFLTEQKDRHSPAINPVSREIVKGLRSSGERVEDRLIRMGKVIEAGKKAKEPRNSPQKGNDKVVTQRLMQYQQVYRDHKMMLRHQLLRNPSWKPTINKLSEELAGKQKRDATRPKMKPSSVLPKPQFPFSPTTNKVSTLISQRLPSSTSRLLSPRSARPTSLNPQCTFHPSINCPSTTRSESPRWQSLYSLNFKSLESIAKLRYEARVKEEEIGECTFRPRVIDNGPKTDRKKPVIGRLFAWDADRKTRLKQVKTAARKEALEECTFSPAVSPTQRYTAPNWRESLAASSTLRRVQSSGYSSQRAVVPKPAPSDHGSAKSDTLEEEVKREKESESRELSRILRELEADLG